MKLFSRYILLRGFLDFHIILVGFFLTHELHYVRFIVTASWYGILDLSILECILYLRHLVDDVSLFS